jgi:hypothetical protein
MSLREYLTYLDPDEITAYLDVLQTAIEILDGPTAKIDPEWGVSVRYKRMLERRRE